MNLFGLCRKVENGTVKLVNPRIKSCDLGHAIACPLWEEMGGVWGLNTVSP
jgi:hypothetical protein